MQGERAPEGTSGGLRQPLVRAVPVEHMPTTETSHRISTLKRGKTNHAEVAVLVGGALIFKSVGVDGEHGHTLKHA